MSNLPVSLRLKSRFVATPFEGIAKTMRHIISYPRQLKHPELAELYLEDANIERILAKRLSADACGVDVGCHIGSFLSLLCRYAPRGSHVAIEASPEKSEWLKKKFPLVSVRSVAVGDENGTAIFSEDIDRPGYSSLNDRELSSHVNKYEVQVRTLDGLLSDRPRVDFIKIDIEGGELNALKGATAVVARHRPIIMFECGSEWSLNQKQISRRELFDMFSEKLGYSIYTATDLLFEKGPLGFDEFRKCGLFPFRAFNFFALPECDGGEIS